MAGGAGAVDGHLFVAWIEAGLEALEREKAAIDALNVFPVPDGDTGTNMFLTFGAARREVQGQTDRPLRDLAAAASRGALLGARGNSGVILSQFFRGFARGISATPDGAEVDAGRLARALQEAADTAYQAVIKPVEGTMLSVGKAAARAAVRAARRPSVTIETVLQAALESARVALARTPKQLPVLAQAGVVDAGGQGLVVLLDAVLQATRAGGVAEPLPAEAGLQGRREPASTSAQAPASGTLPGHEAGGITEAHVQYRYCTEFIIRGRAIPADALRRALTPLGDSLLVVGDAEVVKVHVHTNRPGQALEIGVRWGELLNVSVNNMQEQNRQAAQRRDGKPGAIAAEGETSQARGRSATAQPRGESTARVVETVGSKAANSASHNHASSAVPAAALYRAPGAARAAQVSLVAVVSGEGLRDIFQSLGVEQVVDGGTTMNPSTEELVAAVEAASADSVILLPNNKNVIMTAQQVQRLVPKQVAVVPSHNAPEGLAAALSFSGELELEANAARMQAAVERVSSGEVTYAIRDSRFGDREIRAGDVVGMAGDQLVAVGQDMAEVTLALARHLVDGGRTLVTLYYGRDVERGQAEAVAEALRQALGGAEVELYFGGQPLFYFLLSAE